MKFTKCNEEQFFKIFPPEDRKSIIIGGDDSIVIRHSRFVCCDRCNTRIYEDPNEVAYLILELKGWRSTSLECNNCFKKRCMAARYDPEIKELTVDEAIDYLESDAGFPCDEDDEFYEDEEL